MRAHTVILGAGATMAPIPNGDKNGKKSSVMQGMIHKLGLEELMQGVTLETTSDNIEDIYSEIYGKPEYEGVVRELEKKLYDYFDSLELPDSPTIYDFLLLSLTSKDVVATFNWDPLLVQAYVRCFRITENLPKILCLHGNVAIGYCETHREFGTKDAVCPICKKQLPPIKLLYPVKEKNYKDNDYIKSCWDAVDYILENSYMITIFGYSAPSSDIEAVNLLKKAWGGKENRQLEEVSIIDIIDEEDMLKKWDDFIYSHHYRYTNNFFDSYLGMFPRRSCETVFAMYSMNIPADGRRGFKQGMSWEDINFMIDELSVDEYNTPDDKNLPLYYTAEHFMNRK
ncbi:MAG: hypothetical protein SO170_06150 [Butyribacter sp.]|nr:hypothetical protein [bacterium]MDY3854514.1 hypothetical protein [Butyribacter sp.]